ncbi:hypothetical protein [Winogradskyella psychrotolerans]|nr:hypothetical protein [Winogradskyella psychrotolerans]
MSDAKRETTKQTRLNKINL